MQVTADDIRSAVAKILDHLEQTGQTEFAIRQDFYWCIPKEDRYDKYDEPLEFTIGQLSDDWEEIRAIVEGRKEPLGYALVWLSSVLRAVGENSVG